MITLSHLVESDQPELERLHGQQLLPSHRRALRAMRRCRRQASEQMLLECKPCGTMMKIPHYCGHRSCPHCQHHDSQQWIERQSAKRVPILYFLVTFTIPAEMRLIFWAHQKVAYDLLLKTAWQTLDRFARRDPKLKGKIGAHAVLHTNNRKLDYHPHVHMLVPAGAINTETSVWTSKKGGYLFNEMNLARVFRGKWFDTMKRVGLSVQETLPEEWVVNCKAVDGGEKALIYLGKYF